ncbi:MAG: HAD-IA family hydrolase [Phycisphaeraceae bacterium]|nr:HAD-IA family hydrolase [Phycisphaeraceae bacterium]MCW5761853.1 HAD-IA family hydrolase [Phycisphaeraceae bacterium]
MTSDLRVVCFDWGGVILRICRSWREGCARAGLPLHERVMDPEIMARRRRYAQDYQIGALTCDEFFQSVADLTDGLYSPADVQQIHAAWLIEEYPGISKVIGSLSTRPDVHTALLSNTNAAHWSRQHSGPNGFPAAAQLRSRLASHELRIAKPDRSIYTTAAEHFGVEPRHIVFFDDLAENVEAARACGWNAHQIDHEGDTASQIIAHLAQHGITLD